MAPRLRVTLTLALASGVLSGCASHADIRPVQTLRDAESIPADASLQGVPRSDAAWPNDHWWMQWRDRQLDALVDEALAQSPSVAMADARARKAIAQAGMADAQRLPQVGASAQASALQIPETLAPPPIGGSLHIAQILGLNLKYAPDLWGKDHARWQAALGTARATEVDAQAARLTLVGNLVRTYIAFAQAHDSRAIAARDVQRLQTLLTLAQQRARAGIDNRIAVEQADSALRLARQHVDAAQQQITALGNALATLAGAGPDRALQLQAPTLQAALTDTVPEHLPSGLLARRPDIVAARWRVQAAGHGIHAAKAAFYPSINLSALVGVAAGSLGDLFGTDALIVNGGPALTLPIFEGGALRHQLAGASADRDLAVAQYNQTLLTAIREVVDAVQAARSVQAQLTELAQAQAAATRAADLVAQRRRAGLATELDRLNARKPLLQIEQQRSALLAKRRTLHADLAQALGGGIPASALASPPFSTTTPP